MQTSRNDARRGRGRTTLRAEYVYVLVWCKSCHHRAPADLQAIVDAGRGDVPLINLRFRCTGCGSRMTNSVLMARDALGVQPWRAELGSRPATAQTGRCDLTLASGDA